MTTLQRGGVPDANKALVLAALDITDELFQARAAGTKDEKEVGKRLATLVSLLEHATPRAADR